MKTYSRILITTLALILGIAVLVSIVGIPSMRRILTLAQTIEQERITAQRIVSRAVQLRDTTKDIGIVENGLNALKRLFVPAGSEIDLFSLLEQESRAYNLTSSLRIGESKTTKQNILELPIDLEITGPAMDIFRFLVALERSDILFVFQSIGLRSLLDTKSAVQPQKNDGVTANIKGLVYVLPK